MDAVRVATLVRSRASVCVLLLAGCLVVAGCGGSHPVGKLQAHSRSGLGIALASSRTGRRTTRIAGRATQTVTRQRSAIARERLVSLAAAKRTAAEALSAKRERAAIRAARRSAKHVSRRRLLVAERQARQTQRVALARAKKTTALALKADPASCLTHSGALAVTRGLSRTAARVRALRVRRLVLGCLRTSQSAVRASTSATKTNRGA